MAFSREPGASPIVKNSVFDPRRVLGAFALGAALSVAGVAAFSSNIASAHGPFAMFGDFSGFGGGGSDGGSGGFRRERLGDESAPSTYGHSRARYGDEDYAPRRHRRHYEFVSHEVVYRHAHVHGQITFYNPSKPAYGSQPVCVRLCDGAYFPMATAAGDTTAHTAACASQCPDAPTEVYYLKSDKIEDSVSAKGQPYTALPVSLRYRTTFDNTCTCHRDAIAYAPLDDATLKKGDAVMTPAGVLVFSGAEGATHKSADFTALAAAQTPAEQKSQLKAMERVSLAKDHPSLTAWLAAAGPGHKPDPVVSARANEVARGDDRIRLVTWRGAATQD